MKGTASPHARRTEPRRGAILAAVLVCILVILLVGGALVKSLTLQHRQSRIEQEQLQAMWLAQSALSRAIAEIDLDPNYTGSTWTVELDGPEGARVGVAEIAVELGDGPATHGRITIAARWPNEPVHRIVHRKQFTIQTPPVGEIP